MARAFVVSENQRHSYADLLSWAGELKSIFPPLAQVQLNPQSALTHAREILCDLSEDDCLVLVGDPVLIGICMIVDAELHPAVHLLPWDPLPTRSLPITIDTSTEQRKDSNGL